jgi:hypothetical protein
MQTPPEEAETMTCALLLFGVENGGETNLNHQRRQESDDKSQHRINPNPHRDFR